jgi:DnaJ family protein C protein 9
MNYNVILGSNEEIEDLKSAYLETKGSIGEIMTYIPHSTIEDEPRLIAAITKLIDQGDLPKMQEWDKSVKDEKARLVRRKEGENEAKEAEALAKELGVWDEFYGNGKIGDRKSKSKEKNKEAKEDSDGEAVLQALILKKREKSAADTDTFFDGLLAKYGNGGKQKGRGNKRNRKDDGEGSSKSRSQQDDIPDEEFAKLQERLFGDDSKVSPPKDKPTRKKRKVATK